MLPPYGRPGVTSGAPTGSRRRFWRRGDIHVARITDAYTRVKRGQSHTRGGRSCCLPPVGRAPQVAPPRGAARFWRRGDIHVARIADAYMRRAGTIVKTATNARPCRDRWAPGVTSGASTDSRARFWRRGDIHVARIADAYMRRVKRKQSHTRGGRSCCLPSVGRASQVAPPRIRDAVRRRDDARPCRARWAPGVTSGAPTGSRARFWRRATFMSPGLRTHTCGGLNGNNRTHADAHTRLAVMLPPYGVAARFVGGMTRGHAVPDGHRASQVAPPRVRGGSGEGATFMSPG